MFRILNARVSTEGKHTKLVTLEISRGRIGAIRGSRSVRSEKLQEEDYDARGKLVIPAFIDCHCHLFSLAESFLEVKLWGTKSISEFKKRISDYALQAKGMRKAGWIFGRGWDQDFFEERRYPTRFDIDEVVPDQPVILSRVCGHVAVMNSKALEFFDAAHVLDRFPEGLVPKDRMLGYIGIIKEGALGSCWETIPQLTKQELQELFLKAQRVALSYGLAGAHCILDSFEQLEAIEDLDQKKELVLKLGLFLPIASLDKLEKMKPNQRKKLLAGKKFRVLGFKVFADGSLGARTAALNEPYSDDPNNSGILNYSTEELVEFSKRVKALGLVQATHAIGDRSVEQVTEAYYRAGVEPKDQFRIEHCSIIRPQHFRNPSGAVLVVQPMFASSDYWLKDRIGVEGRRVGYAFKTLSKKNNFLVGSSDAPVESIDPLTGIGAAIANPADPSESMGLEKAIALYTENAAKLSRLTKNSGAIKRGKACDLVILDREDLGEIANSKVLQLFIDGKAIL